MGDGARVFLQMYELNEIVYVWIINAFDLLHTLLHTIELCHI